jgi:hypothetical protein
MIFIFIYRKLFLEALLPLHSFPLIPPLFFLFSIPCGYLPFWGHLERTGGEWRVIADASTAHAAHISGA